MTSTIASTLLRYLEAHGYEIARHEHVEQSLEPQRRELVLADLAVHVDRHLRLAQGSQLEHVVAASHHLMMAARAATDVATRASLQVLAVAVSRLLSSKRLAIEVLS